MTGLFGKRFADIDESDIRDLVARKVREFVALDYKEGAYGHSDGGTREMLADVTAMANAVGGFIIIGVSEDKGADGGNPKEVAGIEDAAAEADWLRNVCISSVDEPIAGLEVRPLPMANGRGCVIVRVPNSMRKPHMAMYKGHSSFSMRHDNRKAPMGMGEVRSTVLSMSGYQEELKRFQEERISELWTLTNRSTWLFLMATPIYLGRDRIDPLRPDLMDLLTTRPGKPRSRHQTIHTGEPEPRQFGVEAVRQGIDMPPREVLRLLRSGHFEFCAQLNYYLQEPPPGTMVPIETERVAAMVVHFLKLAKRVAEMGEIYDPWALVLYFANADPSFAKWWGNEGPWGDPYLHRGPGPKVEIVVNDLGDPSNAARQIVQQLMWAYGVKDNKHFDQNGRLRADR